MNARMNTVRTEALAQVCFNASFQVQSTQKYSQQLEVLSAVASQYSIIVPLAVLAVTFRIEGYPGSWEIGQAV